MQSNQNSQIQRMNDGASVVSAMINPVATLRRRQRFGNHSANHSSTSSNTDYEVHLKIDRILYNAYGDILSVGRTAQIDWENQYHEDENCDITMEDSQNDAIGRFLIEFIQEQPDDLIDGIANVDLSTVHTEKESNESHSKDNNQTVHSSLSFPKNTNTENAVDDVEIHSEQSSIISIQNRPIPLNSASRVDETLQESCAGNFGSNSKALTGNASEISSGHEAVIPGSLSTPRTYSIRTIASSGTHSRFSLGDTPLKGNVGGHIPSSFGGSRFEPRQRNSHSDTFSLNSEECFEFSDFNTDINLDAIHEEQLPDFFHTEQQKSQPTNAFTPTNHFGNEHLFPSEYFSEPFDDDNFSSYQDDIDDFGNPLSDRDSEFGMGSFTSHVSSSAQKQRPNISNIKKTAMESRSLTNLPTETSPGIA